MKIREFNHCIANVCYRLLSKRPNSPYGKLCVLPSVVLKILIRFLSLVIKICFGTWSSLLRVMQSACFWQCIMIETWDHWITSGDWIIWNLFFSQSMTGQILSQHFHFTWKVKILFTGIWTSYEWNFTHQTSAGNLRSIFYPVLQLYPNPEMASFPALKLLNEVLLIEYMQNYLYMY